MAKTIESFPTNFDKRNKYPWHEWANGQIWQVVRGVDFETSSRGFSNLVYVTARRNGKLSRAVIDGDTVTFQFYEVNGEK